MVGRAGYPPENTRCLPNALLVLGQRRERWANTKTALGKHLVFAGPCRATACSNLDLDGRVQL